MSKPFSSTILKLAAWTTGLVAVAAFSFVALPHRGSHAQSDSRPAVASTHASAQQSKVRATLGALPLAFEANQGQSDPQVKYMARGNGYTLFLTSNDAVFSVRSPAPVSSGASKFARDLGIRRVAAAEEKTAAIHMQLLGGKASPQIAAGAVVPGIINYYRGNDRSQWIEGVKQYASVNYRDVYPGVNVAYHGEQRQLEFDFIVSPGASAAPIKLGFNGASTITTDESGNLILSSDAGNVLLHKPVAYQEKDGRREPVEVAFQQSGRDEVGLTLGSYDHSRELVIDPTLLFVSYVGGNNDDEAYAIAIDGALNTYLAGETKSSTFAGKAAGPNFDAFVSEFNTGASTLIYTSIFSGTGDCSGNAIAVDASGNAYVAGSATSGFTVTAGTVQTTFGGGALDGFVMKLSPGSSVTPGAVIYSTYLGGNGRDVVNGLAIDAASPANVYVAGDTFSSNFPGTSSSTIQSSLKGTDDNAFIAKLNGTASAITYSTYLGGTSFNLANAIALDGSNNAYVTGLTGASDFPVAPSTGALQSTFGGNQDAFVSEINAAGSALVYSTYLGGSATDAGLGIAVDSAGEAYIAGSTQSSNFPILNAAQTALGGSSATNVFVAKLNADGTAMLFSTYYGGNLDDAGTGVALDSFGDAYVTGRVESANFPITNGSAFQTSLNGTSDGFVTEFSNTGFVEYSSFMGGPGTENGVGALDNQGPIGAIVVDGNSNVYVAGDTSSSSGFAFSGAYQSTYGGAPADAFFAKIGPAPADFSVAAAPTSTSVSSGSTTSQITVTVSSVNASFGQAVTLSCGSLPTHAACQFTSSSLTPTTTAQTTTLTISTNNAAQANSFSGNARIFAAFFAPMIGIALIGFGKGSRKGRVFGMFILTLALMALLLLPACGGGSSGGGGGGGGSTTTPAGTYHITISGAAGGVTHSAPFTLTVN